jgi:hypothetical protein
MRKAPVNYMVPCNFITADGISILRLQPELKKSHFSIIYEEPLTTVISEQVAKVTLMSVGN